MQEFYPTLHSQYILKRVTALRGFQLRKLQKQSSNF